ncbi:hypothetical protein [Carboxylicivirga sp. RSCT41]|uniref:hypothetical protein n=1 Tax=Carboxylicivirga agarovorans TaxID=3417570 RepID=UPI003D333B01
MKAKKVLISTISMLCIYTSLFSQVDRLVIELPLFMKVKYDTINYVRQIAFCFDRDSMEIELPFKEFENAKECIILETKLTKKESYNYRYQMYKEQFPNSTIVKKLLKNEKCWIEEEYENQKLISRDTLWIRNKHEFKESYEYMVHDDETGEYILVLNRYYELTKK